AGDAPVRDRLHLLLAEADVARGLAVLREDEAAAARVAGADLPELAQLGRELALAAAVEGEAADGVVEGVRHEREHRPPVAGRAGRGAGRLDRIALAEERLVERLCGRVRVLLRDLAQSRHGAALR